MSYGHVGTVQSIAYFFTNMDGSSIVLWSSLNAILALLVIALRRHVFYPMLAIVRQVYGLLGTVTQEGGVERRHSLISMRAIAGDMARMAQLAQDYYLKNQDAQQALVQARTVIAQINAQQQAVLETVGRGMLGQYQSVLSYANYLEERIARQSLDPGLRYDFDDVSESSFNLKLISGALGLIEERKAPENARLEVPQLMQQTLLALAASLDRRSMRLTTSEVDLAVVAQSDPAIVAHVLWMMLLGTIRYAADESLLRLRCLYNHDHSRALISIVVSELSPGRLTEDERGAFLERQSMHLTPHMFAETIRIHANIQLAELLMQQLDGELSVLPLTSQSCEICLSLPAAPAPTQMA